MQYIAFPEPCSSVQLGPIPADRPSVAQTIDELTAGRRERGDLSGGSLLASGDARVAGVRTIATR